MSISVSIIGTGSVLPDQIVPNSAFLGCEFYDEKGQPFPHSNEIIIQKFEEITEIRERRWANPEEQCSTLGTRAAAHALEHAGIDPETLDLIIVTHNFGDLAFGSRHTDQMPTLASRVKAGLGIHNPNAVAFDVLAGCPGWVQSVLTAQSYMLAGFAKRALVVGNEMLSRTLDVHDRDSMIFADGAGAVVLEAGEDNPSNILGRAMQTYTSNDIAYYLKSNPSNKPGSDPKEMLIKMKGRKIYEFALRHVPDGMKAALDNAGVHLSEIKKIFIHQANAKLDHAVIERLHRLYGMKVDHVDAIAPMSIQWLGNSSVATVPTLLDLVVKTQYQGHKIQRGDLLLFASVGAGMTINAFVYRW
jgi:3-oxoacyl-[acyl-carrier-protein] synthase-3